MRIAVLASGDGWHVQDLVRAAAQLDYQIAPVSFRHLLAAVRTDDPAVSSSTGTHTSQLQPVPVALSQVDRVLVRTMPAGSLEQIIFRMDALHRLSAAGVPVLNSPRGLEAAIDKYLAICRMEAAGLPVPPTMVCERADLALEAMQRLGGDVVIKPLFGSEGKGITRLNDPDVAYRVFTTLERIGAVLYVQRFVEHDGFDLRAFVLGDRVLCAMRRRHDQDWRTNVARGATAEPTQLSADQAELAIRAARSVDAVIAGVDLLPSRDGRTYVLEVNAVPGWRALARVTETDVARHVLQFVASSTVRI